MTNKLIVLVLCLLFVVSQAQHEYKIIEEILETMEKKIIWRLDTYPIGDTKSEALDFAKGFLVGIGKDSVFDNLKTCISDDRSIEEELTKAFQLIKTKNPEKVKEGIELIGQTASAIPVAAQVCQAAGVNIENLIKMVETFKSPQSFAYYVARSLIINHVEVIHEVTSAVEAYDVKNFTGVGFFVGEAMDTIFLGDNGTITQKYIDYLNENNDFKSELNPKFAGMTIEEIKRNFLGARKINPNEIEDLNVYSYEGNGVSVPDNFNSSKQWPGCIHPIRNQKRCGSCWAFAASEVLSDRFCIASKGKIKVVLSPQYLISCDNILDHGCHGGTPSYSWMFITRKGLPLDSCVPYASGSGVNPIKCSSITKCADGTPLEYYKAAKGTTAKLPDPASIQQNILKYGPVETGFEVYTDFMNYKSGIYVHKSGQLLGGHAVKIIGWGKQGDVNYWIVANSWDVTWGIDGYFLIKWGQVGIDSGCIAAQADVSSSYLTPFWKEF